MERRNVPRLRFPGFEGEWHTRKIKDLGTINPSNKNLPDEFIYIDLESVNSGILSKEEFISKVDAPSRAQRLLSKNDILYQTVRPYQKNNFFFDKDGDYVASTGYAQIRANENAPFLFQFLHFQKFVDKVIEKCIGTSYPSINSNELANIDVAVPNPNEQQKIASFLNSIDQKLIAIKKKKSLLEKYKKGMMQKIFDREVRFKDEDGKEFGEWENVQLRSIATFFSGGTPLTSKTQYYDGDIPFIKSGEINNIRAEQFITELGLKSSSAKMVKKGDLLYALYGATSGEVAISKMDGAINQAILCICYEGDARYLHNFLLLQKETILSTYLQGGQGNLSAEIIKSLHVPLPSVKEQTKIANFLSAIDDKVNLVVVEIERMEFWKKGLLGEMFV
jgi:type I restriction enzyme S subunit